MSISYDLNTAVGQVRFFANDRDITDPYWTDEEITMVLGKVASNPELAAALCLRAKANDNAYLAKSFKIGNYSESTEDISKGLIAAAESIEKKLASAGIAPDGEYLGQESIAEEIYTEDNFNQIMNNKALRGETD